MKLYLLANPFIPAFGYDKKVGRSHGSEATFLIFFYTHVLFTNGKWYFHLLYTYVTILYRSLQLDHFLN